MKRPNQAALVFDWNHAYSIGTSVTHYAMINPLREPTVTKTRSDAWLMGGHTAMVMVEGVAGGVCVESVVPIPKSPAVEGLDREAEFNREQRLTDGELY